MHTESFTICILTAPRKGDVNATAKVHGNRESNFRTFWHRSGLVGSTEYYRLHDSSVELAKISKLLLKVDGGNPQDWKGCRLDDINLKLSDDDASSTDEECEEFQQAERVASIREDDIEPDTDEGEDESEHVEANNTVGMCKIETADIIFIFAELWFL